MPYAQIDGATPSDTVALNAQHFTDVIKMHPKGDMELALSEDGWKIRLSSQTNKATTHYLHRGYGWNG